MVMIVLFVDVFVIDSHVNKEQILFADNASD